MSDTERMYRLLCQRGPRGAHTHELRSMGYSGNPSQRAADIEAKYGVTVDREREMRNGRNGSRFKLAGNAGISAGSAPGPRSRRSSRDASTDSGDSEGASRQGSNPGAASPERSVPAMFDPDIEWS